MAEITINAVEDGTTAPYIHEVARHTTSETWNDIISSSGTDSPVDYVEVEFLSDNTTPDRYTQSGYVDLCFDLTDYSLLKLTAAKLEVGISAATTGSRFATDAAGGIALVGQRESVRGLTHSTTNYVEIYQGAIAGDEYATRIPRSSISAGTSVDFNFNSAGLAYLNGIMTKTDLPGYAVLGIVKGGIVDGLTPSWNFGGEIIRISSASLVLTYTAGSQPVQINVSDTWKDVQLMQINVSNSWKYVSALDLNIGDTWKEIV